MAQFTLSAAALINPVTRSGGAGLDISTDVPDASGYSGMAMTAPSDLCATLKMLSVGLAQIAPDCARGDSIHIAIEDGEAAIHAEVDNCTEAGRAALKALEVTERLIEDLEERGVATTWLAPVPNHRGLYRAVIAAGEALGCAVVDQHPA